MQASLTHEALRTRIAKVRSAAQDHDLTRLRWEFERMTGAFAEHLALESSAFAALSEPARRELRDGQARIRRTLAALASDVERSSEGLAPKALIDQLDALVELQDDTERRGLRHRIGQPTQVSAR